MKIKLKTTFQLVLLSFLNPLSTIYPIIVCTQYWLLPPISLNTSAVKLLLGRLRILFGLGIPSFFNHSSYNRIPNIFHSSPVRPCLSNKALSGQISNNLSWWWIPFSIISEKLQYIRCVLRAWNITSVKFHLALNIICVITNISNASYSYFMNWNHLMIFLINKLSQGSKRNPYTCAINIQQIHSHVHYAPFLCSISHINWHNEYFRSPLLLGLILCHLIVGSLLALVRWNMVAVREY